MINARLNSWQLGALVAGGLLALPAQAAQNQMEEVVVTAQRTEEGIQEVPIAVTAFTGEMLENKQILSTSDLQMNTPNVSFSTTNFGSSSLSIRGIGRLVTASTGEAGVSIHLNEIAVPTNLNAIEYYDMARVEVLRGPQGTLFGRNATGGAINMVTQMPQFDSINGFIDGELGDYEHRRLKGAFNMPINDTFALRFAGMMLERDGYIENLADGQVPGVDDDIDGRDLYSFRVTAKWDFSDNGSAWLMYSKFDESDDKVRITNQVCKTNTIPTTGCLPNEFGFESPHLGTTTGGIFGGNSGALQLGDRGKAEDGITGYDFPKPAGMGFRDMHTDFEPIYENEEELWSFGISYDLGDYNFGLTGAYQESEYRSLQDYLMDVGPTLQPTAANPAGLWPTSATVGPVEGEWDNTTCNWLDGTAGVFGGCILNIDQTRVFAYDQSDSKSEYWTVEAKVASNFDSKLNFIAGFSAYDGEGIGNYYVNANTLDMVGLYGVPGLGFPPLYPTMFNSTGDSNGSTITDGWAAFGEVYYDFSDDLKFTFGLRYNEDNKEVRDTSLLYNAVNVNAILGGLLGPDPVWTRTTGFLFGGPSAAETDLINLYAPSLGAAAASTGVLSPERLAVSAAVPIVPLPNEARILTGSPSKNDWTEVTGRIGFDYQLSENSMVYGFFSRGYKPGGFNPPISPTFQAESAFTFDSEEIDSIEFGIKNTLLDGGLVLNGTFFMYDYTGLQVARIANNTSLNDNIDAEIMGVEIEGVWFPESVPNLTVDFSYSWLDTDVGNEESVDPVNRTAGNPEWILLENFDPGSLTGVNYIAKIDQVLPLVDTALNAAVPGALSDANGRTPAGTTYPNGIPAYFSRTFLDANGVETSNGLPTGISGNQLPASPEHTIHLGVAYRFDLSMGALTARWDYYWQDDMYAREFNTRGDAIDSWDQHNASLVFESTDRKWTAKAWIRNLQDEDNITGKYLTADTSGFFRNYFLTEPRIYGLSLRYEFDPGN